VTKTPTYSIAPAPDMQDSSFLLLDTKKKAKEESDSLLIVYWTAFNTVLLVVLFILLSVFYFRHYNGSLRLHSLSSDTTTSACDDGRVSSATCLSNTTTSECNVGYLLVENEACFSQQASPGTSCTSACYLEEATTTTCNSNGQCQGNTTECRGYCQEDSDCIEVIPFNTDWFNAGGDLDDPEPIFYSYKHVCHFNRCELFTLDRFITARSGNYMRNAADWAHCDDYLNTSFINERKSCLRIERYLIDTNLTSPSHYIGNYAYPPQFSMCLYYYECAELNQTAIGLASNATSLSVNEQMDRPTAYLFSTESLLKHDNTRRRAETLKERIRSWMHLNDTAASLF
jgi:hypothetical protein